MKGGDIPLGLRKIRCPLVSGVGIRLLNRHPRTFLGMTVTTFWTLRKTDRGAIDSCVETEVLDVAHVKRGAIEVEGHRHYTEYPRHCVYRYHSGYVAHNLRCFSPDRVCFNLDCAIHPIN